MSGHCEKDGVRIGFGQVSGKIVPAYKFKHQQEKINV